MLYFILSYYQDKENAPQGNKKLRKFLQPRRDGGSSVSGNESQGAVNSGDNLRSSSLNHNNGK